ncbi:hypothetical protein GCM10027449_06710 [Sinomonas notoginsengisoli]
MDPNEVRIQVKPDSDCAEDRLVRCRDALSNYVHPVSAQVNGYRDRTLNRVDEALVCGILGVSAFGGGNGVCSQARHHRSWLKSVLREKAHGHVRQFGLRLRPSAAHYCRIAFHRAPLHFVR